MEDVPPMNWSDLPPSLRRHVAMLEQSSSSGVNDLSQGVAAARGVVIACGVWDRTGATSGLAVRNAPRDRDGVDL
jgi:hypothetical protein